MSPRKRRSQQSGRAPLSSPGRPPAAKRSELQRFWLGIARGMPSEDAALAAGLSQPVGTRLFREAGGMPPATFRPSAKLPSGRYLSFSEREEIALFRVQGLSGREIGRRLGRPACTISRELRRNGRNARRWLGISRIDSPMACRTIGSAPESRQTCAKLRPARLCRGEAGWNSRGS